MESVYKTRKERRCQIICTANKGDLERIPILTLTLGNRETKRKQHFDEAKR